MKNGESWLMDPAKRDYVQTKGSPVVDKSLKMPIYFRTLVHRTRWMYAPDVNYGSDFWQYRDRQSLSSQTLAQGIERKALQPIIDDGRAIDISVTAINDPRRGIQLNVKALDASGQEAETVTLSPILT